jgi:phosphatidylserine/phosphatidylglycerophosphate/cardiolipin synthase-like enzyme
MNFIRKLSRPLLLALADALSTGKYQFSEGARGLSPFLPEEQTLLVADELHALAAEGLLPLHLALMLRALAAERAEAQAIADRTELVWSGEELPAQTRSTAVVVQQLFEEASETVLVASYAFDHGSGNDNLFTGLAARMDADAGLSARFFVNVERRFGDGRTNDELVAAFATTFRQRIWPGRRLPEVFFDPRALVLGSERACLHAKCVVIDESVAFVTSANFTESAHQRNFEAGVLVRDRRIAGALARQFEGLAAVGLLRRLPGA